jgi:hypothetical protein
MTISNSKKLKYSFCPECDGTRLEGMHPVKNNACPRGEVIDHKICESNGRQNHMRENREITLPEGC